MEVGSRFKGEKMVFLSLSPLLPRRLDQDDRRIDRDSLGRDGGAHSADAESHGREVDQLGGQGDARDGVAVFFPFFLKIAKMSFPLFFWTDGGRDKKPRNKKVKKQKTHEIRHGAKLTAVAERLMPVIDLETRAAASLLNLLGGLMPLPAGVMREE